MSGIGDTTRYVPWLDLLPMRNYESAEARLEDEIWAYVNYMSPTREEEIVNFFVGNHVQDIARLVFPGCRTYITGSTSTGLRLPQSDIDLVIETVYEVSVVDGLVQLADLVREKAWAENVHKVLNARVPIIKITTTSEFGSLNFDVGINGISGLRNNVWVMRHLNSMPALKPLALIIRGALSQHGLNDASQHGLSSFAVVCMCIFFLQHNPYRLPLGHLADPRGGESLAEILKGFLLYYSRDIPFEKWYISTSRGTLVKKPKKGSGRLISRRCHGNLVIQCPTDPARNITASLSVEKFEQIRSVFGRAFERFQNAEKICPNILGFLVSVDQRFMEYRWQIGQLVQSGQLFGNLQFYKSDSEPEESEGCVIFG